MTNYSILDLSPIVEGSTATISLKNSLTLAQHAEQIGYKRYWVAEHHNMPGVASAATSVVIGHIAGGTNSIRVGAGGIMLPNHSPLVVAEHFGTLETLYPNRIDLGLGRAPGTDGNTARALRRILSNNEQFPEDILELQGYLEDKTSSVKAIRAVPGEGTKVPLWILGSSLYGAQLAAHLGLPFAFASHFSPDALAQAVQVYRENFKPSKQLAQPYLMFSVNVFAADSNEEAEFIRTSHLQGFANVTSGRPSLLPRPVKDIKTVLDSATFARVNHSLRCGATGGLEKVTDELSQLIKTYQPNELIINSPIYKHEDRLRSYSIAAEAITNINQA
ncbi:LLM class flavin-dependent oxidoreductase [uncultured Psychromonas sp.]|uniref:LLM class flavin-dependent oxidoreductase n=1 Tax=uncultured Psychromonas sp. TaxID=173974 RepID=UPI002625D110|nr:LLM class flavin-dependent oxidoreductase [uncultured Psychromonas sp.]